MVIRFLGLNYSILSIKSSNYFDDDPIISLWFILRFDFWNNSRNDVFVIYTFSHFKSLDDGGPVHPRIFYS